MVIDCAVTMAGHTSGTHLDELSITFPISWADIVLMSCYILILQKNKYILILTINLYIS